MRHGKSTITLTAYVLLDDELRVHTYGRQADDVNDAFGKLVDSNHPCDRSLKNWLTNTLFTEGVWTNRSLDDPILEINTIYGAANGFGVGLHEERSTGPIYRSDLSGDTDSNDSYRPHYRIEELPWL